MKRIVWIANAVAVLAVVGVFGLHIRTDRGHVIADATENVTIIRDAMREQTRQMLAAISRALGGVAEDIETNQLGPEATFRALSMREETLASTYAIFVLDRMGRVAAISRTRNPEPVDFSRDPMFSAHRDDPTLGQFIAPPRRGKVGYAEGKWIVTVSRRLNSPDGSFAGVVAAAISVQYLTDFFGILSMGREGVVGIAKNDGTAIARSALSDELPGRVQIDTELFPGMLPSSDQGVIRARFAADGIDRIIAYGRVPEFPVVVYAGVSVQERLSGWRQRALADGIIGLVTIAVISSFTMLLARRLHERQEEQETRVKQLRKLTEISTALLESPNFSAALQRATDLTRELIPCHQAVTSVTEHPSMAQAIHSVSLSEKYAAWQDYDEKPDGSGIYSTVCRENRPMRMTQAELEAHSAWKGFGAAKEHHPPMRGWLAVPLICDDGTNLGLIQLSDRESGDFTAEDEALMSELAHVTSVAVQRLKMAEVLREAVATAKRSLAETELARAAEEKTRSEIEKILTSIRDAVFALDSGWRFTYLNPKAEELLERRAKDLIGCNVWEEFPEAVGTEVYNQYYRAREKNVDVSFTFYYTPLNLWLDVRAFPQADGSLTVYFHDVSRWIEQEEQLRQAQKMEAVGQLTGGVAHDFNNLLTVMLGNAEAVLNGLDKTDENYDLVSMIGAAAQRATDLTHRLLAFSRRQPLDPKAVDVNALIVELEPLIRRTLGEQYDIVIIGRESCKAVVDPGQLQNAIVNLAVNARDAMLAGGRLTIETREVDIDDDYVEKHIYASPGRYVMIAVGDNGIGMTPEIASRAFEPFFTTKKAGDGTGLGLSMVFGFVKQSNGHVNIYSEVGTGTTVKLYLPCAQAEDAPEGKHPPADIIQQGSERILVVEDDSLVREYTKSTLISLGYDVVAVADGAAVRAVLEGGRGFDLLLCDVILAGGMNGRQVATVAHEVIPDLRVLYMSGYTEDVIVHHGRLDADARLLPKPFRRADLAQKVREALDDGG